LRVWAFLPISAQTFPPLIVDGAVPRFRRRMIVEPGGAQRGTPGGRVLRQRGEQPARLLEAPLLNRLEREREPPQHVARLLADLALAPDELEHPHGADAAGQAHAVELAEHEALVAVLDDGLG